MSGSHNRSLARELNLKITKFGHVNRIIFPCRPVLYTGTGNHALQSYAPASGPGWRPCSCQWGCQSPTASLTASRSWATWTLPWPPQPSPQRSGTYSLPGDGGKLGFTYWYKWVIFVTFTVQMGSLR